MHTQSQSQSETYRTERSSTQQSKQSLPFFPPIKHTKYKRTLPQKCVIIFNSTFALCTFFINCLLMLLLFPSRSPTKAPFQSPQLIRFWKSVLIDVAVDAVYSECHHHSNQIQIQIQNNQAKEKNRRRRNKFAYKFDIN